MHGANNPHYYNVCKATSATTTPAPIYVETSQGSRTCPPGYAAITDELTCIAAQGAMRKYWARTESWSNMQPGCFGSGGIHPHYYFNRNVHGATHRSYYS